MIPACQYENLCQLNLRLIFEDELKAGDLGDLQDADISGSLTIFNTCLEGRETIRSLSANGREVER